MAAYDSPLNKDVNNKLTSADWDEVNSRWVQNVEIVGAAAGSDPSTGEIDDAAVTDPSLSASVISLLKGLLTFLRVSAAGLGKAEDAAHVSGDTGLMPLAVRKDTAAVSSGTTGDYEPLQTDSLGRLRTLAKRDPTDALSIVHMAALASSQIIKASAGTLHSIIGYVASGEDGWILVHDAVSAPIDTSVPELAYFVPAAAAHQPVNIPLPGHVCATGITLVWSTTGPTKTLGAAKMMVAAYYE